MKITILLLEGADQVVNSLDNEKVVELLIDIQSRLGRIEERVSRQEGVEAKADEALALAKKNAERNSEMDSRVTKLEQSRDWTNKTAVGAIISAAVAILSVVFPHFVFCKFGDILTVNTIYFQL